MGRLPIFLTGTQLTDELYVGVDAGGTHTRMVLADRHGALLADLEGGPGNYQLLGAQQLTALIEALLQQLRPGATATVLCAGVAGAGREAEQVSLRGHLENRGVADRALIVSDARAALEGAHAGQPGVVCIAGTGSMVLGRNAAGDEARAGGWGPALGDEGSAYALVMAGVRRALQAVDGSGKQTRLQQDLLPALGLAVWSDVIAATYGGELTRERIAEVCPTIFAAARVGDEVAAEIITSGGLSLGAQVAAVARRLHLSSTPAVACVGGIFAELDVLRAPLAAGAGEFTLQLIRPELSASLGALLLAFSTAGISVPAAVTSAWASDEARSGQP